MIDQLHHNNMMLPFTIKTIESIFSELTIYRSNEKEVGYH